MILIVGLGNPGKEYENTRHNMGFMAIDTFARMHHVELNKSKFGGLYGEFRYKNEKVILLKPQKYINLSGEVICDYLKYFKISIDDLLVISDDLDLELGRIRLRYQGGSGGHNGLKNIELHLKTKKYKRIRIGISNNKAMDTKDYVLGHLNKDVMNQLQEVFETVSHILDDYFEMDFNNVMNKYNK